MGFIEDIAPLVQKHAKEYGILCNSAIIGQACIESGLGTSELSIHAHNYFGLKYRPNRIDCASGIYYKIGSEQNKDGSYVSSNMAWFKFNSMENGVLGYLQFINILNYNNLKGVADPRRYLELIKQDKYATSLDYVDKVMNVVDKYGLRKYDNVVEDKGVNGMAYKFYTKLAHASNYGGSRSTSAIKYIVMHYTANKTDTAYANANYFQSANRNASAHFFCDKTSVYQSVPDLRVAWSVGGSKYSDCAKTGGGKLYKICTNTNSISIELCSDNGAIANETVDNAVELVKSLMIKYNIPVDRVVRHFDVNGKKCIGWNGWLPTTNETLWNNFKSRLGAETVKIPTVETPTIETPKVNLSGQKAINYNIQVWINEYLGGKYLVTDGLFGTQSKKYLNMCLEKALGITSRNGVLSSVELDKITYTKVKNSKELTKVLEAYLYVRGLNPQEFSGVYTDSVKLAVKEFQRTVFTLAKDIDGLAGTGTFKKIVF